MTPALLSVRDVGELLGISPKTVRSMIARGDLPVVRLNGRLLRVRVEDVERLITAHLETASTAGTPWGEGPRYSAGSHWWRTT